MFGIITKIGIPPTISCLSLVVKSISSNWWNKRIGIAEIGNRAIRTNGNTIENISDSRIEPTNIKWDNIISSLFYSNKYYLLHSNGIYILDLIANCWYTIDKNNIVQLIESYNQIYCLCREENGTYAVYLMFGSGYSGDKIAETFYQIVSDPQYDVRINDLIIEADTPVDEEKVSLDVMVQGQDNFSVKKEIKLSKTITRYNKVAQSNIIGCALKTRLTYSGENPPVVYSIGEVRTSGTKQE